MRLTCKENGASYHENNNIFCVSRQKEHELFYYEKK